MLSYAILHSFFNFNTVMCDASYDYPCFEKDVDKYMYRLCPFEKVSQFDKVTGEEFKLGNWSTWKPNGDLFYDQGDYCNTIKGPRTTEVVLTCGVQNKLFSITEVTPCKYYIKFETPNACGRKTASGYSTITANATTDTGDTTFTANGTTATSREYGKTRKRCRQI